MYFAIISLTPNFSFSFRETPSIKILYVYDFSYKTLDN